MNKKIGKVIIGISNVVGITSIGMVTGLAVKNITQSENFKNMNPAYKTGIVIGITAIGWTIAQKFEKEINSFVMEVKEEVDKIEGA